MGKLRLDLDSEEGEPLTINTAFARSYDNWRRLEEIQKLKDRVGEAEESCSDSQSSEEPAEWTTEHEKDFLYTLAALKTKDPKIYSDEQLFKADVNSVGLEVNTVKKKEKREKPLYLKDYERKLILERNGNISEDDDEILGKEMVQKPGYFEEQEKLKEEFKLALEQQDDDDVEPLLKKKVKPEKETTKEEDEYYEWLRGQDKHNKTKFAKLKGLRELWSNNESLDGEEKFLRDFLLEKKYDVDNERRVAAYDDIANLSDDEEELDREQTFEQKYNFRYEEPDKEFIKQYPRTIKESLRRVNEKRKELRGTYKERKAAEKQAKVAEIRELKALKKKEIKCKLEKLKKLAGEDIDINFDDIEGDFDPAKYDQRMKEIFNKDYYEEGDDEEKPVFSEVSDVSDDDEAALDELVPSTVAEEAPNIKDVETKPNEKSPSIRRKKRNSLFFDAVAKKKPLFDPNEKTFEEYFNEYYALDYEDIIGDTITRFKYRNVPANSFGLTGDEILNADDRQLNAWASLKKVTAYRTENEEKYDILAYAKKAQDLKKKQRIFNMTFNGKKPAKSEKDMKVENDIKVVPIGSEEAGEKESVPQKPERKRKKKQKTKLVQKKVDIEKLSSIKTVDTAVNRTRKKKKEVPKNGGHVFKTMGIDDDRLRAYGLNPKKFKNKLKWSKKF